MHGPAVPLHPVGGARLTYFADEAIKVWKMSKISIVNNSEFNAPVSVYIPICLPGICREAYR